MRHAKGLNVGWVEFCETHQSPCGGFMVGLAELDPPYNRPRDRPISESAPGGD